MHGAFNNIKDIYSITVHIYKEKNKYLKQFILSMKKMKTKLKLLIIL